jgi:hypothetical protein
MLPKNAQSRKITLRSEVAPIPGFRGQAQVRVSSAGKKVWQHQMDETSKPVAVAIELPAGSEVTIEVDFGKRLALPCGVDWRDAHMLIASSGRRN